MLIQDLLELAATRHGERPAVWHQEQWHSYAALEERAARLAHSLVDLGVMPGDRVGVLSENSPAFIIAHFAAHKAGAVVVPFQTDLRPDALGRLILDCEARVLFLGRTFLTRLPALAAAGRMPAHLILEGEAPQGGRAVPEAPPGSSVHFLEQLREAGSTSPLPRRRTETDLAVLLYTSGSTGRPKGVMLSHLNLVSNAQAVVQYLELTSEDRGLVVLPFFYVYGQSLLYTHFLAGGSVVIENRFAFPSVALDTLRRTECTGFSGVPSTFMILLSHSTLRTQPPFPSLRYLSQAGGALAPHLQREVAQAFHPARLFIMYGATEASPRLTYLDPELLPRKWGSIGRAVPGVEVFVADSAGRRLPPGQQGEIVARGPNIMLGYWKDPQGTAEVLREGLYFTGDLGYEDDEGCLYIAGRSRDIIKAGGNRVSALEIEEFLLTLEGVKDVAVFAVKDPVLGEAIKGVLVVAPDAGVTEERVRSFCRMGLPPHKHPKYFEFRAALPKSPSGKVLKGELGAASEGD